MNNFKLLTETKTIITSWAVPQDAVLENLNTGILYDYCLDQVYEDGEKIEPPKVHSEFKKTLEFVELSPEEEADTIFYPQAKPLDIIIDTVETLLVQNEERTGDGIINSLENLELLKNWITMRMAELSE